MTLCETILIQHAIGLETPFVETGQVLRIAPDWLLSSEAAWFGMEKTYNKMAGQASSEMTGSGSH
jgi:hypothetical protein